MTQPDATAAAGLDAQHPWPGLAAYEEGAGRFFQGRDDEKAELLRLVQQSPHTALYGKSGLGKSSLLKAGLFPLLREAHFLPVYLRLNLDPGARPPMQQLLDGLLAALEAERADFPAPEPGETIWLYLHRRGLELWSRDNYPLTPVLVIDQFEELFAPRPPGSPGVEPVMNDLGDLIESRVSATIADDATARARLAGIDTQTLRYRTLLSFREDYLPAIKGWEPRIPSLLRRFLHLQPMGRKQAIAAVAEPGAAVLAPGVAERIVDFVGNLEQEDRAPGAAAGPAFGAALEIEPVLLSLCCAQLNARRAPGSVIDGALLDEVGQDILQRFYADALAGMPESVPRFIEDRLVQGDRYRAGYPVQLALDEKLITRGQLKELTDHRRLLRVDPQGGVPRVELIHDRLVGVVVRERNTRLAALAEAEAQRARAAAEAEARRQAEAEAEAQRAADEAWAERERVAAEARARERQQAEALQEAQRARRSRDLWITAWVAMGVLAAAAAWGWMRADENAKRADRKAADATALATFAGQQAVNAQAAELAASQAAAAARQQRAEAVSAQASAAAGWREADRQRAEAERRLRRAEAAEKRARDATREATALRLASESGATLANLREGGDELGLLQVAAAARVAPQHPSVARELMRALADHSRLARLFALDQGLGAVAASADGTLFVGGGLEGGVAVWGADERKPRWTRTLIAENAVYALALDRGAGRLAVGDDEGLVHLLDATTGRTVAGPWRAHEGQIRAIVFTPGGQLVTAGYDGMLRTWPGSGPGPAPAAPAASAAKAERGPPLAAALHSVQAHQDGINGLAISPDGELLASASQDKRVRLWRLSSSDRLRGVREFVLPDAANCVAFSPDGTRLAVGGDDRQVRVWSVATGEPFVQPRLQHEDGVTGLAWMPDGKLLVSASYDKTLRLWNADGLPASGANRISGHDERIIALALPGSSGQVLSGAEDGTMRLWNIAQPAALSTTLRRPPVRGLIGTLGLSVSETEVRLFTNDGSMNVWDRRSGADGSGNRAVAMSSAVSAGAMHPTLGLAVFGERDGAVTRLVFEPGRVDSRTERRHTASITALALGHDGGRIASGDLDGRVAIWDRASMAVVGDLTPRGPSITALRFVAGGQRLLVGDLSGQLRVLDTATGTVLQRIAAHDKGVRALALHPQPGGGLVASGGADGRIRLWELKADQTLAPLADRSAHEAGLTALAFRADGKRLASGSDDSTLRLWEVPGLMPIGAPMDNGRATAIAFSPLGDRIYTAGRDRAVRAWIAPERWLDMLCAKLSRGLGPERWRELGIAAEIPYAEPCPGLPLPPPPEGAAAAPPARR